MPALAESNFLQALGWAIINCFWQMALLWVIFKVALSLTNKIKSSTKAGLANIFLLAGFAWFLISFITATGKISDKSILSDTVGIFMANGYNDNLLINVLPFASIIYLVILIFPLRQFIRNYRYVQIIRKDGLSKIDADRRVFVQKLSSRLGIKRKVNIWLSAFVNSPVTIGYLKPVILIPAAAINHLTPSQMEAVLLHELAHIRRHDYLLNLLINCIKTVLYFNPFVHLFSSAIEEERETSCDELVVRFQYDVYSYASALLILEKSAAGYPQQMTMAAMGNRKSFLRRIEKLIGVKQSHSSFSLSRFVPSLIGILFILGLNAFLLVNKKEDKKYQGTAAFTPVMNLLPFFAEEKKPASREINSPLSITDFIGSTTIVSAPGEKYENGKSAEDQKSIFASEPEDANEKYLPFLYVTSTAPIIPDLTTEQEIQLKVTLDATKKVFEETQWKEIEKSYADLLNTFEKEKMKVVYESELEKQNWKKYENQLKVAYDHIDWAGVNAKLNSALTSIKVDSITNVFNLSLNTLVELEKDMKKENIACIPDTDITLQAITEQKKKIKEELNKIHVLKTKKIIRL